MSKLLGKCHFCDDGHIEVRNIKVNGKPTKLYACSNAHWVNDSDLFELSKESTCSFRIFQNSLLRWNKKALGEREIRNLLSDEQITVRLYSSRTKSEYFKYAVLDEEYGLSVLWDDYVDDEDKEQSA